MESLMQMSVHAPVDPEETMQPIGERIQELAAVRPHQTALIDERSQRQLARTGVSDQPHCQSLAGRRPEGRRQHSGVSAAHPGKWDSVGMPTEGAEVRVIDDHDNELPRGETGEIVGRAISMMRGYVNRDDQHRSMLWTSPYGLVVLKPDSEGGEVSEAELLDWANGQLGKAQRMAAIEFRVELPRASIGKVLKRELRAAWRKR